MRRRVRAILYLSLLIFGCYPLFTAVRADNLYYVAGAETVVGNSVCGAAPCTETVNFSFDLSWQFVDPLRQYVASVTNLVTDWSGPLGPFTRSSAGPLGFAFFNNTVSGPCFRSGDFNYLALFDAGGDEIDITLCNNGVSSPTTPFISYAGELYGCGTATCVTDFSLFPGPAPQGGILIAGTVESSVREIPEPTTLLSLMVGLFGWAIASKTKELAR